MTTKVRSTSGPKRARPLKKRKSLIAGSKDTPWAGTLSEPRIGVTVKRGRQIDSDNVVLSTNSGTKAKGKKSLLRDYSGKAMEAVGSVTIRGAKAPRLDRPKAIGALTDTNSTIEERLLWLGVRPGSRLDSDQVVRVLTSIREGAEQIIGSGATVSELLANANFDGTGMTAEELVRKGRAGRVLSRLDDLRFGSRG